MSRSVRDPNYRQDTYAETDTKEGRVNQTEAAAVSPILFVGMKAYIWVDVFGMWQNGIWDGNVWRVADNDTVENRFVSRWVIQ